MVQLLRALQSFDPSHAPGSAAAATRWPPSRRNGPKPRETVVSLLAFSHWPKTNGPSSVVEFGPRSLAFGLLYEIPFFKWPRKWKTIGFLVVERETCRREFPVK